VDAIESNINFDFYGAMAWQGWSCTHAPSAVLRVPRGGGATRLCGLAMLTPAQTRGW